ncbi:hypothetical protein D0469_17235 [Peribacillus saganii]|uniref:Uncharacterized protein n=1 Tax=Peribacillus saganii TaxID=2303992 RepID=A0A372LJ00_9BACI|nr:hypothetical protein [Peribacillus saganii]RFU66377.1 hypothetical protein D0469_17235 [Peribacillus saganii]
MTKRRDKEKRPKFLNQNKLFPFSRIGHDNDCDNRNRHRDNRHHDDRNDDERDNRRRGKRCACWRHRSY